MKPRTLLALAVVAAALLAVGRGAVAISPAEVMAALGDRLGVDLGDIAARKAAILWSIRLPRVVLAVLVGAALGASGATLQGVVRNPLADPGLIGVSGGAALGAIGWIVVGKSIATPWGVWPLPLAAFAGALATTAIALQLARVEGRTSAVTLLLGGIGLASLTGALVGILIFVADDTALRSITFWSLGSLGGATWPLVGAAAVPIGLGLALLPRLARDLDRLALGELEAWHVGVDVERVIRRATLATALAVGAAVATCGMIGFVGLIVPYLARGALGPGHRRLLPASALGGALLLVLADLIARTIAAPAELPVGILTAAVGAPILLVVVRRGRAGEVLP
ncbi:MAG TPA: iron ABC transporter permease [Kofleriaceae bacterium]|nr:iron ABC transporter permease [Kofleriaceae bacterium]